MSEGTDQVVQCSTIADIKTRSKELKGGPGSRGWMKGFIFSQHDEEILEDMLKALQLAVKRFNVRIRLITLLKQSDCDNPVSLMDWSISS